MDRQRPLGVVREDHAAEAPGWQEHLPHELGTGQAKHRVHHVIHVVSGVLERRLGRCVEDDHDLGLVFRGRELLLRKQEERHDQSRDPYRNGYDLAVVLQETVQRASIESRSAGELGIHETREPTLLAAGRTHAGAHDRRQRQRDDARDEYRHCKRECELLEEHAGQTGEKSDRGIHRGERQRHRDDGGEQLPRARKCGLPSRHALAHVARNVLDDDDRVVHDQPYREHDGEYREQVQGEAHETHRRDCAEQRDRDGHKGDECGSNGAHERDNHETDKKHGLDQRDADLPKRVAHVLGHVVADRDLYAVRQACVDVLEEHIELVRDLDLVRAGQRPDRDEYRGVLRRSRCGVGVLRAKFDTCEVTQAYEGATVVAYDEAFELIDRPQIRVHEQFDALLLVLGAADRRDRVVPRERSLQLCRRHVECRHPLGIEPHAHGRLPASLESDSLHARDRG